MIFKFESAPEENVVIISTNEPAFYTLANVFGVESVITIGENRYKVTIDSNADSKKVIKNINSKLESS